MAWKTFANHFRTKSFSSCRDRFPVRSRHWDFSRGSYFRYRKMHTWWFIFQGSQDAHLMINLINMLGINWQFSRNTNSRCQNLCLGFKFSVFKLEAGGKPSIKFPPGWLVKLLLFPIFLSYLFVFHHRDSSRSYLIMQMFTFMRNVFLHVHHLPTSRC